MTETQENKVPTRYRRFIAGGAVALAVLAGGVGIAAAQSSPKPSGPGVTAPGVTAPQDTGNQDTGNQDTGNHDTGNHDTGNHDTGNHDTGNHDNGDKPDTAIKSSVTSPEQPETAGQENETPAQETAREAAETASLAKLAKVTPEQARDAALKAVPGTIVYEDGATLPQLSNDNGNVVYEITINSADGKTQTKISVDAGNAKVLATEVDAPEAHEAPGN